MNFGFKIPHCLLTYPLWFFPIVVRTDFCAPSIVPGLPWFSVRRLPHSIYCPDALDDPCPVWFIIIADIEHATGLPFAGEH